MQKKIVKRLVSASYVKNNQLDEGKVNRIASLLTRRELKAYIKALKTYEKQQTVLIESSFPLSDKQEHMLKEQFSSKKIVLEGNPDLLFGIKVTENDLVYDMNMRKTLEMLEKYVEEEYD